MIIITTIIMIFVSDIELHMYKETNHDFKWHEGMNWKCANYFSQMKIYLLKLFPWNLLILFPCWAVFQCMIIVGFLIFQQS